MTYTRDRLGRIATVKDGASPQNARMLMYNGALQLDYEFIPGLFLHAVARTYATSAPVIGRPTGVMVGTSQVTDLYYSTTWGYDDQGRLERVTLYTPRAAGRQGPPPRAADSVRRVA